MTKRIRTEGRFEIDHGQYGRVFFDEKTTNAIKLNQADDSSFSQSCGLSVCTFNEWNVSTMIKRQKLWGQEHKNLIAPNRTTVQLNADNLGLWMPFYREGNLHKTMTTRWQKSKGNKDDERRSLIEICKVLVGLVRGLRSLQSLDLMHRDIKVTNVMIHEGEAIVIDLGMIGILNTDVEQMWSSPTAIVYKAPELLSRWTKHYGCEIDVWSVGAVAYELMSLGKCFFSVPNVVHDQERWAANSIALRTKMSDEDFKKHFGFTKKLKTESIRYSSYIESIQDVHGQSEISERICGFLQKCLIVDPNERKKTTYEELETDLNSLINFLKA